MKKVIKMFAFVLGCSTCTQAVTAQLRDAQGTQTASQPISGTDQEDSGDALSSITDLNKLYSL
jgi:hypothetical protein